MADKNKRREELLEYLEQNAKKLVSIKDGDEVIVQRFTADNVEDYLSQYYGFYRVVNKLDDSEKIDLFTKHDIVSCLVYIKAKEIKELTESMNNFSEYYINLFRSNLNVLVNEMNVFRCKLDLIDRQISGK